MNFQQIDLSYIPTMDTTDSICTDDDIEDLIEDVLKSIDEFEETNTSPTTTTDHESSNNDAESTITTISSSNSINYSSFGLFSPNPFYPGQPLPIPQQSASTPLSPTLKYLMHKLLEKDDDNDGLLDLQEFTEAIHEFDTDVDDDDIEDIFSSLGKGKYNEISINKFIEYIRCNSTKMILSESAATFTSCTNCEVEFATTALYICTKHNCTKFGEPYCEGCGESSHKRKNHSFNIDEEYIKKLELNTVQQNINLGISTLNRTLEIHYAKAKAKRDINVQAASASVVSTTVTLSVVNSSMVHSATAVISTSSLIAFGWCAGLGAVAMAAQQVITHSYRYYKGEITKRELCYNVARGLAASVGTGLGSWGGMAAGAVLGTLIGGPIGAIIGGIVGGIVGGLIGANIARKAFEKAFEKLFPDDWMQNGQGERKRAIRDSLKLFGFSNVNDIANPAVFNERELKKTYRTLAKRYHPDKNGGTAESYAKFHEINTALGILLGLLEKPNKTKVVDTLSEIRAITWKINIKQLSAMLQQEKLLYIVDICCKWNKNLTMEFLSRMRSEDILETINDLNDDGEYDVRIKAIDKTRFVQVIEKWRAYSDKCEVDESKHDEDVVAETEAKDDEDIDDDDDIEYDEMLELRDKLRKGKVLFIVDICKEQDEDCTLVELLSFRKNDILRLLDEINNDDSNEYNIHVMKKNKFAKIISEFASKQPELCLAK